MKWKLPAPRELGWKMKSLQTAKTSLDILKYGSYEARIDHDIIRGCSPVMIEWWFKNIGGETKFRGKTYNKYLLWHPVDHIHWALVEEGKSGVSVGAKFRIVEAFGGREDWMIDTVENVTKLDETGIRLRRKFLGLEIYSLEHKFSPHPLGTTYVSRLQVGSETLIGRIILNPIIQTFIMTQTMTRAWLQHNIEEVGNFEFFLREIYEEAVFNTSTKKETSNHAFEAITASEK